MSDFNQRIIKEFRENNGKVGGGFANTPLLLLHTVGAKSGEKRLNPVAYLKDGKRLVVVASKGGADSSPDWYYNLEANPDVEVELGDQRFEAQAEVTEEPERSELYGRMEAINPGFTQYKHKTDRKIPVVVLKRKD